ncbi:hypothetical protein J6590_079039 [Homalodisca vitripennis]|nr:hypothetical protein J6590_079039 [Homalodisca vitripennis]
MEDLVKILANIKYVVLNQYCTKRVTRRPPVSPYQQIKTLITYLENITIIVCPNVAVVITDLSACKIK